MRKLFVFVKKNAKALAMAMMLGTGTILAATPISASDGTTTGVDLSGFTDALLASITPSQILAILAQCVAVGMTFFLMWLGVRKAVRAFTSAVATGKIRL